MGVLGNVRLGQGGRWQGVGYARAGLAVRDQARLGVAEQIEKPGHLRLVYSDLLGAGVPDPLAEVAVAGNLAYQLNQRSGRFVIPTLCRNRCVNELGDLLTALCRGCDRIADLNALPQRLDCLTEQQTSILQRGALDLRLPPGGLTHGGIGEAALGADFIEGLGMRPYAGRKGAQAFGADVRVGLPMPLS